VCTAAIAYVSAVLESCESLATRTSLTAGLLPSPAHAQRFVDLLGAKMATTCPAKAAQAAHVSLQLLRCNTHNTAVRSTLLQHVPLLVELLRTEDLACLRHTSGILWLLACEEAAWPAISDAGGTSLLVSLMSHKV
jgi:hypothetical protein